MLLAFQDAPCGSARLPSYTMPGANVTVVQIVASPASADDAPVDPHGGMGVVD
jgi:hypothetical protein